MRKNLVIVLFLAATVSGWAESVAYSFSGQFQHDDDLQAFIITVNTPATLTAQTLSFAKGGFAPVLTLFSYPTGDYQAIDYPGLAGHYAGPATSTPDCGPRGLDPNVYENVVACYDAYFEHPLATGSYLVTLTQDDNLPLAYSMIGGNFSDGFFRTGDPQFTLGFIPVTGATEFIMADGYARSPLWEVRFTIDSDVVAGDTATQVTPEPGTIGLLLSGAAVLAAYARRRTDRT